MADLEALSGGRGRAAAVSAAEAPAVPKWRILVTGSRDWPDPKRIYDGLAEAAAMRPGGMAVKLVNGMCDPRHPQTQRPIAWLAAMRLSPGDQMALLGADWLADCWARWWGWEVERVPADWEAPCRSTCRPGHRRRRLDGTMYCPAAGDYRNAGMIARGADVCPAFIKDHSHGATHCAALATRTGILVMPHRMGRGA